MNRTINELKSSHLLNEKIANDLLSPEAKTPQFKMLPKVHKEGNPGRPAISSTDCHTTKISKYINNQLQPRVKVQLIAILQRFQNTLITSYSHM